MGATSAFSESVRGSAFLPCIPSSNGYAEVTESGNLIFSQAHSKTLTYIICAHV